MQLNELKDNKGARYKAKRVGRGIGSGKGKTAGSGYKGQKSRTGVAINGFEGGQMPLHRRLPKRGFTSLNREKIEVINIGTLNDAVNSGKIAAGEVITRELLYSVGLLKTVKHPVKLLAKGELNVSLTISLDFVSKTASLLVEQQGGTINS